MTELKKPEILKYAEEIQLEKYKFISYELFNLKNLIKGSQPIDHNKENIFEFILYPELISIDGIKNNIFKLFNVTNNNELEFVLLEEINILFQKENDIKNSNKEIAIRCQFYKILESLSTFVSHSLIYFQYNNNNKSFEFFNKWILFDNKITKSILYAYIKIFNLKNILYDFYAFNREKLLSLPDNNRILFLISILNLQIIFPFEYLAKKKNNFFAQKTCIYELFNTYNRTIKEVSNLTDYLSKYNSNSVQPSMVEKIINDNDIQNRIDTKIKSILIEKLMINFSLKKETNNKENEIFIYYKIILNNIDIISKAYVIDWIDLNAIFKKYLENKDYDKNIEMLSSVKSIDIMENFLNDDLLIDLLKSIPIGKIKLFSKIIKPKANIIKYLLNTNTMKNRLKIIKILKLNKNEYDPLYDKIIIDNFLINKINSCIDNSFDILIDYALIDNAIYNTLMYILMKKKYLTNSTLKNNNDNKTRNDNYDIISLNEEDEEVKEDYRKIIINDLNSFDNLNQYFLNESKKRNIKYLNDRKKNNILSKSDKEKILCIYHMAKSKNYKLTKYHQKIFDEIFQDVSSIEINYSKYISDDKLEPHDSSCISINSKIQKISFIDNIKSFKDNFNFFKNSKYIGIDSEWRQPFYSNIKGNASILQLSNYSETNVMIIDLLKMNTDNEFFNLFEKNFKDKIFIGYSFSQCDIEQFEEPLKNMFQNSKIIDLIDLYQHKFLKKVGSLKDLCKEILGSNLCKYEQCSNWENRPLRKRQLHYAALDAIICVSLFKKLRNTESE